MKDATGKTFYTDFKKPEGTFSMQAPAAGKYSYCFSNEMSTYSRKVLSSVSCQPVRLVADADVSASTCTG